MTLYGTVTGTFTTPQVDGGDAHPARGVVVEFAAQPSVIRDAVSDVIVIGAPVVVTSDQDGTFTVELIATDNADLNPSEWTYAVTVTPFGGHVNALRFSILVPAGSTQNLADIIPVPPSVGVIVPPPSGVDEAFVEAGDAATLQSANAHTDAAVAGLPTKAYVDAGDAAGIEHADTGDAATLTSAKTYTDAAVGGIVIPDTKPIPGITELLKPQGGYWFGPGAPASSGIVGNRNRIDLTPIYIPARISLQAIGVSVSTANAPSVVRLGIYRATAAGMPGTVLIDAGTVDSGTTGDKAIPINVTLDPGLYYLAALIQIGFPSMRAFSSAAPTRFGYSLAASYFANTIAQSMNFLAVNNWPDEAPLGDLTGAAFVALATAVKIGVQSS